MEQHSDIYSTRCEGRKASSFHKLQRVYTSLDQEDPEFKIDHPQNTG